MLIQFTPHAQKKLKQRGILTRLVEEVLSQPEKTYASDDKLVSYKKFGHKYLLVIYERGEKVITVTTLFWRDDPNW